MVSKMTVLVTGGTGFIGGRLVERLTLECGLNVRAYVRDFHTASWLARTSALLVPGDLGDKGTLQLAMEGCETVYHCAACLSEDWDEAYSGNVIGTQNVMEAACAAGVRRVVIVSSVAVHSAAAGGRPTDENTAFVGDDAGTYAQTKLQAEQAAMQIGKECGIEVVVLRPTIVYGPRAPLWTIGFFRRILARRFALPRGLEGRHNFIYVDDVVTALIRAGAEPRAAGQAFIVGADESTRWVDYLNGYAQMAGRTIPLYPAWFLKGSICVFDRLDGWIAAIRVCPSPLLRPISFGLRAIRRLISPWRSLEPWELVWFRQQHVFSVVKSRDVLGFRALIPMPLAMAEAKVWLREQGHFPGICWADDGVEPFGKSS